MSKLNTSSRQLAAANQNLEEKKYWLQKLAGQPAKTIFPLRKEGSAEGEWQVLTQTWKGELFEQLQKISGGVQQKLHILLFTGLNCLLSRLTGTGEILLGTPIFKSDNVNPDTEHVGLETSYINTLLALRSTLKGNPTFKDLILQTRETIVEAVKNQDYPLGLLVEQLEYPEGDEFPLFDILLLLENIQDNRHVEAVADNLSIIFSFLYTDSGLEVNIKYRGKLYTVSSVQRIHDYFSRVLTAGLADLEGRLASLEILSEAERQQLLHQFNDSDVENCFQGNIQILFQEQVKKTPDRIAVIDADGSGTSYAQLNRQANRLARLLRKKAVGPDVVVGLMMDRSVASVAGMLAILKAGGAWLPIDTGLPRERVRYMLEDSGAHILVSNSKVLEAISFTALQNFESSKDFQLVMTPGRPYIKEFETMPVPDRWLINLKNYRNKIGMASVSNSISLQTTRGCPYECLFCHKVWSKRHVFRTAESIFEEVSFYYSQGVKNFSVIDDCFNLNLANSQRFFKRLIESHLEIQLFFPNGLRGDLLTREYIDLMVAAGTRGINLSLETASPRLQKLVKKNLDLEKFRQNIEYIAAQHPVVILEIASMHGFPTETEEEAMMTLDFIKSIKWLHFPYIHILKIYPNTEMEDLALKHGVSKEDIMASKDLAFHELPETLPFPKSFTRKYQSDFMNNYFLDKERLLQVLPVQLTVMSEDALVEKYNAYLPTRIKSLMDLLKLAGLENEGISYDAHHIHHQVPEMFNSHIVPIAPTVDEKESKKILLLDLSQHFSSTEMLYNVVEQPLGLISLLTFLKEQIKKNPDDYNYRVSGRIYKSGNDFDSFSQLKELVDAFSPDLVGIRTLTFYKEFFHETVSLLRQWGVTAPIIAGGPYATSDYDSILKDRNVNLAVFGEGEYTFLELVKKMMDNEFQLPSQDELHTIPGLVFARELTEKNQALELLLPDKLTELLDRESDGNPEPLAKDHYNTNNLAYVMYTSGSTGKPKGVMVEHRQVNNCLSWMQDFFTIDEEAVVAQRTNLTFDPSVWEIFWPLYQGAAVRIFDEEQRRDPACLVRAMEQDNEKLTIMYCPSTMLKAIVHYLEMNPNNPRLTIPWFIIGAEPVSMDVIKRFYSFYEGRVVNTYGPTEGTINNTYYYLDPNDNRAFVPIGQPVANNRVYVLARDLKLLPVGIAGEICLAGDSLARGYINNNEKTLTCFINNPFGSGKLYKTGDVGRWLEDGNLEIMGRLDEQVKIRGHRIELGEIGNVLTQYDSIKEAVVVAKTNEQLQEQVKECKICGIWSNYPGIKVNGEHVCNICENLSLYKKLINQYFQTSDEFEYKIREGNRNQNAEYDCVLVYACERVATYALYKLLDMGFRVMTVTYDSGHYGKESLDRITRITKMLGVDHQFLRHKDSDKILRESLKVAKTMCKGCIHTSSSLAGEFAYKNNIKFVIGETLSRGQIVENKLFKFLDAGIHDVTEIEIEVRNLMRSVASMDKSIYDIIDIDVVKDGSLYDKVEFIDFYRYFDISHEEIAQYLDEKDSYWKNLESRAAYSTDCKICQVGDFNHMKELGYHYTGSAKSWEKRLGQATMQDVKEDLKLTISADEYDEFLDNLGYQPELAVEKEEKHLCAYYVHDLRHDGEVDVPALREYLFGHLPEYMVPSFYVPLEKIPLTASGKINRNALPAPQLIDRGSREYAPPETEIQEKVRDVWQEVLGVEDIGIHDDLFKLGGDSIKAIRISSKLQKYNLKLEIRDLFQNPTVKKSSRLVEPISRHLDIPQEAVEGDIQLTPVQHWFIKNVRVDAHHFNQSVMLFNENGFDEQLLNRVFKKILQHHDILRARYSLTSKTGYINLPADNLHVKTFEIESPADARTQIESIANEVQQSNNPEEDTLLKPCLFKGPDQGGDYLLVVCHHLVIDGISWRILLEDFEIAYLQAQQGLEINFQPKTHSFQFWAQQLNSYARGEQVLQELTWWQQVVSRSSEVQPLPRDHDIPHQQRLLKDMAVASMQLDRQQTSNLLTGVHHAFNTEINDILLAALNVSLKRWTGSDLSLITLEGHGREDIIEGMDISRTIGWFTTQFPLVLRSSETGDLSGVIKSTKETLRQVPNKGIGYGILRYLSPDSQKLELEPEIIFNYLGQVGNENIGLGEVFQLSDMPTGNSRSLRAKAHHTISIDGMVIDGTLRVKFSFNRLEYDIATIENLADDYRENLANIINLCMQQEEMEMTVSDYDAVDLDEEEVDSIYDELELE